MKTPMRSVLILIGMLLASYTQAEELMIVRSKLEFPEAMLKLQEVIKAEGYVVSRVQRVDVGLTNSGYTTDKYRVVFYGKADETHQLIEKHPQLAAYLPLKIAIFAEQNETLLVSAAPTQIFGSEFADMQLMVKRWQTDLVQIFDAMRAAE